MCRQLLRQPARALLLLQKSYSLLYSFQSPCGSSFPYEGAMCVVFKMVLQPDTWKLIIQCIVPPKKKRKGPHVWTSAGSSCFTVTSRRWWVSLLFYINTQGIMIIVSLSSSEALLDYVEQMETRDFNIVWNTILDCRKLSKLHQSGKILYFLAPVEESAPFLKKILTRSIFNMTSMKYSG